jgi:TrmH family RNA methyltransferase
VDFSRLRVVLVSPRNPLNIGAVARAMSNLGFTELRLVNPYHVAFREARSAVKAAALLQSAREYAGVAEAVADCTLVVGTASAGGRELQHSLKRLESGGREIREHLAGGAVALLFGSEKFGLANEDLAHCHWLMRIPTREEHESMNLGQAVAVCLYELIRDPERETAQTAPHKPATAAQMELFTSLLLDVLNQSGYINERVAESTELKVRRLARRLDLSAHDAEIWLGIWRQILWRLKSTPPPAP